MPHVAWPEAFRNEIIGLAPNLLPSVEYIAERRLIRHRGISLAYASPHMFRSSPAPHSSKTSQWQLTILRSNVCMSTMRFTEFSSSSNFRFDNVCQRCEAGVPTRKPQNSSRISSSVGRLAGPTGPLRCISAHYRRNQRVSRQTTLCGVFY